jgi:hypothetical protein
MSQLVSKNKALDKEFIQRWEQYRTQVERDIILPTESEAERLKRIAMLQKDEIAFCKYYFPQYAEAEFAPFHKRFMKVVIKNDTLYITRAWAREHAKSVVAGLFLPIYLMCTKRLFNMLLVSHSADQAEELLMPIMIQLESNPRLIADYGKFKSWRGWEVGRFVTSNNCSFRAIGSGQSPRGTRNAEKRPDFVLIDDIDTDEERRNQSRIDKKWEWIEKALYPAMSISGSKRFVVVGNIIAKESIIVKAARMSDDFEQINILDKNGQPSWKERYTLQMVNYMLSKISYAAGQSEYFNNPITVGSVFKDMTWGKVPSLDKFKYLVSYTDPSYKSGAKNDFKATILVGEYQGNFYVIRARLEQTTTATMIDWHYDFQDYVGQKSVIYFFMEQVFLQDIFLKEFQTTGKARGSYIPIVGDDRKKPDKFSRIEANLEPLNRTGRLILNEKERECPHMLRLEEQFKALEPNLSGGHDDGPDAVEGAVFIINHKMTQLKASDFAIGDFRRSKKKY